MDDMFEEKQQGVYIKIASDGTLREKTTSDDPKAVARDWSLPTGEHGTAYEKVYSSMKGKITFISIRDTNFGTTNLNIGVQGPSRSVILTVQASSPFADSILQAIPNLDREKEVTIEPVSFTNAKNKLKKYVKLVQDGKAVDSFFQRYNPETKKGELLNGYPAPTGDTSKYTKERWVNYFTNARLFVQDYLADNGFLDDNSEAPVANEAATVEEMEADDSITMDEIPF